MVILVDWTGMRCYLFKGTLSCEYESIIYNENGKGRTVIGRYRNQKEAQETFEDALRCIQSGDKVIYFAQKFNVDEGGEF